MTKMMVLGSALFLIASSVAKAEESHEAAGTASPSVESPAPIPPPPPGALNGSPEMPPPAAVVPPAPPAVDSVELAGQPPQPEPYTGWGRGRRPPMYLQLMLSVGAMTEDGDNRLTTRDSKTLEGFGGILRLGAVLNEHHRIGARMQSLVRPTKQVLRDPPATTDTSGDWGSVSFGYIGPEYLYSTDFGLYAGGSLGVAGIVSSSKTHQHNDDDDDDHHVERGSVGIAGILSVGYEWRANKWFAMNADAFGGYYRGIDDNEHAMDSFIFGLGMGAGF